MRFEHDLPEAAYHADREHISQSQLKTLLDCPARFRWELDNPRPHRDAFDLGHAAHAKVLGVGAPTAVIDADDWRTKAAQVARDEARAAGSVPLLRRDAERVDAMAEAVLAHAAARAILERPGTSEVSMFWTADDVPMRGRIDRLTSTVDGAPVIADLKTTVSAAPDRFARSVYDYGYHIQRAAYVDGHRALTGDEPTFLVIAVEKDPPHFPAVYVLDDLAVDLGEDRYRAALDLYRRCLAADDWPAYGDDVTILPSPRWAA